MKKFFINLILFGLLIVSIDYFIGGISEYLMIHAKGGSTQNNYTISKKMKSDIIILGSSRATHHYIPSVIEKSTPFSCYNCGEEGNGAILAYGRYKMATKRYIPKLVIYEATPEYDYFEEADNSKYLKYLKPYFSDCNIKKIIEKFGNDYDNIKLLSKMYQNNGLFLTEIIDNLITRDNKGGYSPLYGKIDFAKNLKRERIVKNIDNNKIQLIEELISDCRDKGIKFYFFISPRYKTVSDDDYFTHVYSIAKRNNIPIYDFRNMPDISENFNFFNDPLHMNNEGAMYFTRHYVCPILKNVE